MDKDKEHLPLEIFQEWMQKVLVNPFGAQDAPFKLLPEIFQDDIEKIITPSRRLSARARLAIYQRGYLARLRQCMQEQFSALNYALGDDLFRAFADQYLQVYPSMSYTLGDLGNHFIEYLQETRPDRDAPQDQKEDWPDFMIELVQLELAINSIFDRKVAAIFYPTPKTNDNQLKLNPCLEIFAFQFPTLAYYQAFRNEESPELPFAEPSFVALNRHNFQMGAFHLNPAQYYFLKRLKEGQNIEQAQESTREQFQITEEKVKILWEQWKEVWVDSGFFLTSG